MGFDEIMGSMNHWNQWRSFHMLVWESASIKWF